MVSHDPDFNNANTNASNVMIGGFIAAPVILYGVGHFHGNEHARETGLLGAEALLDGLVVEQGMKLIFWRERPYQDMGDGRFFQSSAGVDSSFPSSHSVLAWSTAAVIAGEYRNPWTQVLVYTGAAGVSMTRPDGPAALPGRPSRRQRRRLAGGPLRVQASPPVRSASIAACIVIRHG